MAIYRVVNEAGHTEAEYPIYSAAKDCADKFHAQGNKTGHYRVEEVSIVYHTAQEKDFRYIAYSDISKGDDFPRTKIEN